MSLVLFQLVFSFLYYSQSVFYCLNKNQVYTAFFFLSFFIFSHFVWGCCMHPLVISCMLSQYSLQKKILYRVFTAIIMIVDSICMQVHCSLAQALVIMLMHMVLEILVILFWNLQPVDILIILFWNLQPVDKQSLLDSGIFCCLIHILNALLNPEESNQTQSKFGLEEPISSEKSNNGDTLQVRRLEVISVVWYTPMLIICAVSLVCFVSENFSKLFLMISTALAGMKD